MAGSRYVLVREFTCTGVVYGVVDPDVTSLPHVAVAVADL